MSRPVRLYRKTECCSHGNAKTAPTGTGSPKGAFFEVTHSTGLVNRSLPVAQVVSRRRRRRGPHAAAIDLPRSHQPGRHVLVPVRGSRADGPGRRAAGAICRDPVMTALAPTLQAFFAERQRRASPHTVAAYRDTFRLLLEFTCQQTGI